MKCFDIQNTVVRGTSVLLVFLCLIFYWGVGGAETLFVITNGDHLNGRARPDKSSDVEARFSNGEEVEAVSIENGWVEVIGGETGTVWCKAEYLSSDNETSVIYRNVSGGRVFIRDEPSGKKTGSVKAKRKITVTRHIGGWGYMGSGWVDLSFFEKETD